MRYLSDQGVKACCISLAHFINYLPRENAAFLWQCWCSSGKGRAAAHQMGAQRGAAVGVSTPQRFLQWEIRG